MQFVISIKETNYSVNEALFATLQVAVMGFPWYAHTKNLILIDLLFTVLRCLDHKVA